MIGVQPRPVKPPLMNSLMPAPEFPRIAQHPGRATKADFDRHDHAIVVLPSRPRDADWRSVPGSAQLRAAARRAGKGELFQSRLHNKRGTGVTARTLPTGDYGNFELLSFAGALVSAALKDQPRSLAIALHGVSEADAADAWESKS